MANFVVTGDFGFIGSHLTEELYNACDYVTVFDHLNKDDQNNLLHIKNKITFYKSNLEQIKSTIFSKKCDGIFHLATAPRSSSLKDPIRDIETNCKGMISVLELSKKDDAKVVFTSNSGIYGSKDNSGSIDENSLNNPTTPCDANQLVSELYCKIGKA
jgi:nucleoside-diphosphate-sugar epimerase